MIGYLFIIGMGWALALKGMDLLTDFLSYQVITSYMDDSLIRFLLAILSPMQDLFDVYYLIWFIVAPIHFYIFIKDWNKERQTAS